MGFGAASDSAAGPPWWSMPERGFACMQSGHVPAIGPASDFAAADMPSPRQQTKFAQPEAVCEVRCRLNAVATVKLSGQAFAGPVAVSENGRCGQARCGRWRLEVVVIFKCNSSRFLSCARPAIKGVPGCKYDLVRGKAPSPPTRTHCRGMAG